MTFGTNSVGRTDAGNLSVDLPLGRFAMRACVAVIGAMVSVTSASAAAPEGVHKGEAFAIRAKLTAGPLAERLGTTAYIATPCLGTDGRKLSSEIETVSIPGVLGARVVASTVETTETSKKMINESRSRLDRVNLFAGLVVADGILAVSRTKAAKNAIESEEEGSTFINLKVAGRPLDDVAPNTDVPLPGLGVATLKSIERSGDGRNGSTLTVDMISIRVTSANDFGVPVGAILKIGHARSGFKRSLPDVVVSGEAYVGDVSVRADGLSSNSGALALLPLDCEGTDGKTLTEKIDRLSIDGVAATKAGVSKVFGDDGVARTSARVGRVSLLGGLITASEIRAVAETKIVNGKRVRSTEGSGFSDLKVLGLPVLVSVGPNFRINLPGIGYVTINEQNDLGQDSKGETVVNGLKVVITQKNALGLPVGAKLIVAHAAAGAERTKRSEI